VNKVIIYTRVSSDKQTTDSQLQELRDYCARRNWADVEEITDTISGAKFSRKGLDALMGSVRRGKVDIIVCYKLDRLGRSLSHLAQLVEEFATHKVALVVPGQGIDTASKNAMAEMQLGMLAVFAQFERAIIVERINAGLAAAKARGVKFGRKPTLDAHRDDVARLRAKGLTGRAIAKALGIPSSSAFKILRQLEEAASLASKETFAAKAA
jgi:DNA invertase Pin-like site-specific DNA recombinase